MLKRFAVAGPINQHVKKLITFFFDLLLADFMALAEEGGYTLSKQSAIIKVRDEIVNFIITRPKAQFTILSDYSNMGITVVPESTEQVYKHYTIIVASSAETFQILEETVVEKDKLMILVKDFDNTKT
jgi:hypothetical protein